MSISMVWRRCAQLIRQAKRFTWTPNRGDGKTRSLYTIKPSKNAASLAYASNGRTCATYWSGRTTTMQPLIDAPHVENVMAALQVRAEHLFVVTKPVMALPGQKERGHGLDGKLKMALMEDGRTSITESISAPLGVYLLTGDWGDSARNSHRVR